MVFGVIGLDETFAWWRVPFVPMLGSSALFCVGTATACSPIYLVTWRVARRFDWRGLTACLIAAAAIGPPRDYLIAAKYPEWIAFAPGIAPVLAVSATYVCVVALGHAVMRLVAGAARGDRLARRPREVA